MFNSSIVSLSSSEKQTKHVSLVRQRRGRNGLKSCLWLMSGFLGRHCDDVSARKRPDRPIHIGCCQGIVSASVVLRENKAPRIERFWKRSILGVGPCRVPGEGQGVAGAWRTAPASRRGFGGGVRNDLSREQRLQGECGTSSLPPSAQECPLHKRPRRAGFRGSAPGERVDRT